MKNLNLKFIIGHCSFYYKLPGMQQSAFNNNEIVILPRIKDAFLYFPLTLIPIHNTFEF